MGRRVWERLGYARLSDYAEGRLGLAARSVQDLAHVGEVLRWQPGLREALAQGRLGWTKVRLLARVAKPDDEARWIAWARGTTAAELSREVRAVDRASVEAGAVDDLDRVRSRWFEVACTPDVRARWLHATSLAQRVHGGRLHVSRAAELITAEVLSALPIEVDVPPAESESAELGRADAASPHRAAERHQARSAFDPRGRSSRPAPTGAEPVSSWPHPPAHEPGPAPGPALPAPVSEWAAAGVPSPDAPDSGDDEPEPADAFEIDRRMRELIVQEQRLDARLGPLLREVLRRRIYRALGYGTQETYARERLGIDPSTVRALVRIERATFLCPAFASAYRSGRLTRLKAQALVALVSLDATSRWSAAWVEWACAITLRRLRDDVERALLVYEADPGAWLRSGALPPEATRAESEGDACNEGGASGQTSGPALPHRSGQPGGSGEPGGAAETGAKREIGALHTAVRETCAVRFIGPPEVVATLWAVLATVRRHLERRTGRMPTAGEALGAVLDHAIESWAAVAERTRAAHRVFERDGWRCVVPGCTSMRNLHDHHVRFRAAGGSNALDNRVTLCAFHHLRGVHAGIVRCTGRAPDRLRFALGIRPDGGALEHFWSGDRIASHSQVERAPRR